MGFAQGMRTRLSVALLLLGLPAGPAAARESLGVFEGWGAFRDAEVPRCHAIARPADRQRAARWDAFAAIGYWPRANVRGQIHFRLSRELAPHAPIILAIGERRFTLTGGGADAWAPDRRSDAAILAAIRSGSSMSIAARARTGGGFADTYRLRGAATAIDAAALGCSRQ